MLKTKARTPQLGRPRTKDRPPGSTRATLLKAAADVFAERGYEGASIDAIAERAGLTGGAIYKHFAGKAELLLEVVEQAVHALPLSERLASATAPSPRFFGALVSSYVHEDMRRLRRLAIEIHAAASRDPDAARLLLQFNRRTHRAIRDRIMATMKGAGAARERDSDRMASLLLVLVMGMVHLDTLEPSLLDDRDFARFVERAVETILEL